MNYSSSVFIDLKKLALRLFKLIFNYQQAETRRILMREFCITGQQPNTQDKEPGSLAWGDI